jgi:hypothetical protein
VALALRSSFAASLNELLYVTAGVALAGAVCALALIRQKDFVKRDYGAAGGPDSAGAPGAAVPAAPDPGAAAVARP